MTSVWLFILIWGVWILMPIIVDGTDTLLRLFVVLVWGRNFEEHSIIEKKLPYIAILIPAYNEEKIIDRCLNSIKIQNYPQEKLEVIVIDDGSLDKTALQVAKHINGNGFVNGVNGKNGFYNGGNNKVNGNGYLKINGNSLLVPEKFNGSIKLLSNGHVGKPDALNAGIKHMNHSDLIITIDSDVVLAPDALRNMAIAFMKNEDMGAATGNIEINWEMIEERDENGNLVLDEEGNIKSKKLNWLETVLSRCQFLEYLDAFRLGRQFQSIVHSTYILAGAFSAFRKDVLAESPLYRSHTVSEDFDLTVDIHKKQIHVGYVPDAKAYLEPTTEWESLYAQRVRWCRGQLEVSGVHKEIIGNKDYGFIGRLGFPHMLLIDHTLAFPRLIWTFLIFFFPAFGYPPRTIATAIFLMYLFYVGLCFLQTISAYFVVDVDTKKQIENALSYCFVLPIYRLITFYFRMSGYLLTLKEPAKWRVESPLNGLKNGVNGFKDRASKIHQEIGIAASSKLKEGFAVMKQVIDAKTNNVISKLDSFLAQIKESLRRDPYGSEGKDRLQKTCPPLPAASGAGRRAVEGGPADWDLLMEKGYQYLDAEKYELAIQYFEAALGIADSPDKLILLHLELGKLHYLLKRNRRTSLELSMALTFSQQLGDVTMIKEIGYLLQTL